MFWKVPQQKKSNIFNFFLSWHKENIWLLLGDTEFAVLKERLPTLQIMLNCEKQ